MKTFFHKVQKKKWLKNKLNSTMRPTNNIKSAMKPMTAEKIS